MNRIIPIFLTLFSLLFAGCNNDVFIEPIEVKPDCTQLGPDRNSAFVKVEGKDWNVLQVIYNDGEKVWYGSQLSDPSNWDGNELHISTGRSSLSLTVRNDGVEAHLDRYLGNEPATLTIDIGGVYQMKTAEISIDPTGAYEIEIKDVEYNLQTWSGYPGKDYSYDIYTIRFIHGLAEPTDYSFAPIKSLPIIYQFKLRDNETEFTRQLLESNIKIPVPEYTWYSSAVTPEAWALLGQEVPLSSHQSSFDSTVMIPPMPEPVSLPADKPLEVTLYCHQECVGLELLVSAVDPVTQKTVDVAMELVMYRPEKFTAEVTLK